MNRETADLEPAPVREVGDRRKPYAPPVVRVLGRLLDLTRGGQGSLNDARMAHNWKPY